MSHEDDIRARDPRIAQLEAPVTSLVEQNEALRAENAILRAENTALRERIEHLEYRLNLSSKNSSLPPSQDSLKARAERKKKDREERAARQDEKAKRKQGAQKGHDGHARQLLSLDLVDHVVEHLPTECSCGHVYEPQDPSCITHIHQVFELPKKLFTCTEHRHHTRSCPCCGALARPSLPPAHSPKGYGPRLVALLAAMSAVMRSSRRGLDWLVGEVLGIPSSLGTINASLMEASEALKPGWQQAREAVNRAEIVGCDETGWRKGKLFYWIWLAQCALAAFYRIESNRRKESATALMEPLKARVVVTDRYGAYHQLGVERNQACHAHLRRDLKRVSQRAGPLGAGGVRLLSFHDELFVIARDWRKGRLEWEAFEKRAGELRTLIVDDCRDLLAAHGKATPGVVKWLASDEGGRAWVFLKHSDVELTNNKSERELRRCVCQRNISRGSQSDAGLRLMERLWTVSQTCQLQGRAVLEFMTASVVAHRFGQTPPTLC